jgi:hypothetical protein
VQIVTLNGSLVYYVAESVGKNGERVSIINTLNGLFFFKITNICIYYLLIGRAYSTTQQNINMNTHISTYRTLINMTYLQANS